MLSALHFIRPWCLLAFIPALALFITLLKRQREHGNWEKVCDAALLPYLLQHKTSKQSRIPLLTASLATTLLLLALAGPTWQRIPAPVFRNDSALVIALSLTETMNAADVTPSRLIRARYKISDLLKLRRDGQTALLVYSGDAFTVTPLTNDVDTIDSQLSALTTDIMPSPGNRSGFALHKAVELMKQAGQPNGQILLITDAVDLKGSLPVAKDLSGYSLSVLAVGTADGAPIKAAGGDFVKDDQGNIIIPKLRAADLQQLAQVGHGIFQTLRDDNQDIEVLAKQFNQAQEEGNTDNKLLLEQWEDKGPWLLLAALPFAALCALCFRKGLLSIALVALLPWPKTSQALEWSDLWLTKDQQAQQAFKQQDYDKAAEHFANPAWRAAAHYKAGKFTEAASDLQQAQDADSLYNQGNALAQSGALPEALKAYEQALKLKPNDADTLYNKDLVEKELKKQQQQQKQDSSKQNPPEKQDQQQQQQEQQASGNDNAKDQASESKDASKDESKDESKQEAKNPQQQDAEAKPDSTDNSAQQQAEQKAKEEQAKQEAMQQQAAEQKDGKKAEEKPQDAEPAATASKPLTETQQANEQWLKRIPDDPAGLLKRKFKYQYGQRNATNSGNPANW